ncbi:MAG: DeoR/GlpR family DNA-binding transcription regulator [Synergistaceae bacterium]|jgi:DeoR/GlpR family transcriptional regulator of sugar metabolism|nr:DeoR/GlpR family DNA-binding transcription regulator [Synergistaceae bacterium]
MYQVERVSAVLEYINKMGQAGIKGLSEHFGVSMVTIRKDIEELDKRGLVVKTHGGVISADRKLSYEIPYMSKSKVHRSTKEGIGKKASELIEDNDIVYIDAGSTTLEIAKNITRKNVTVITHDIKIAMEIAQQQNAELIVIGGTLERGLYTLIGGGSSVEQIRKLRVNKSFMGCDGLDLEFGVSNSTIREVDIKIAVKDAAECVILATDASKFGVKRIYSLFGLSEVDKIVTEAVSDTYAQGFAAQSIDVVLASPGALNAKTDEK